MGQSTCNCPQRTGEFCTYPECKKRRQGKGRGRDFTHTNSTRGVRIIGHREIYFRSRWEANFARVLQWHKVNGHPFNGIFVSAWNYEARIFWFDLERARVANRLYGTKLRGIRAGTVNYKPDFKVTGAPEPEDDIEWDHDKMIDPEEIDKWYEVKGYFERKDRTKHERMKKYHPEIDLTLIASQWFKQNRIYRSLISSWE